MDRPPGVPTPLITALEALADQYGGMVEIVNAAALLAAPEPQITDGPDAVRVIALDRSDLHVPDVGVRDIVPGDFLVLPISPASIHYIQSYPNGTQVITLRHTTVAHRLDDLTPLVRSDAARPARAFGHTGGRSR